MSRLELNIAGMDELLQKMQDFQGNAEETINDVLHNEASEMIQDAVQRLMPVSGKTWKGKKKAAKYANSLTAVNENLAVTIKSKKAYGYLYFPDDGSNTSRHVGNQQFFLRGAEAETNDIKELCIGRLTNEF